MRDRDWIRLLRHTDDEMLTQISREYPGMTEAESARVYERIMQELHTAAPAPEVEPPQPVRQARRFVWVSHAAPAAACAAVFMASLAGIVWLKAHPPVTPEDTAQTSAADERGSTASIHAIGETYAAANLTGSGELDMTVVSASRSGETGLYEVTLTLRSKGAHAPDGSEVFHADNFLVAVGEENGIWVTVSPCAAAGTDAEALPYAVRIKPHTETTLTLSYALHESKPIALVTSRQMGLPYTKLTEGSP